LQPQLIGVICKDAGAANQIAHYILNNPGRYIFALQEPALTIFSSILSQIRNLNVQEVVQTADEIITGSGWTSDFELAGIQMAIQNRKRTITHLDHWNNYVERFTRNLTVTLPDEFWVSDESAMQAAANLFRDTKIVRKNDYYLQHQVSTIKKLKSEKMNYEPKKTKNVLFLSEPLIDYAESGEFRLSDVGHRLRMEFMSSIKNAGIEYLEVRIRPHPSEMAGKLNPAIQDFIVSGSSSTPLSSDLAWADVVIGIDSYALFVSDNAGIPTASIANWAGIDASIPRGKIKFLRKSELMEFLRAE
jgi:hypothetical protein